MMGSWNYEDGCVIAGCGTKHHSRGLCRKHYSWAKYHDALPDCQVWQGYWGDKKSIRASIRAQLKTNHPLVAV